MTRNSTSHISFITLLTLVGTVLSTSAWAEACTYREALMALEQGNSARGMALMRMANNDGDRRATEFLARQDYIAKKPTADIPMEARADITVDASKGNALSLSTPD